jgi:DNA sulfur modification protein DndD
LDSLRKQVIESNTKNDGLKIQLADAKSKLKALNARFVEHGGDLYERRESIRSEHERLRRELFTIETNMRRIAASDAPLLLVENLLSDIAHQAREERSKSIDPQTLELLYARDQALKSFLSEINSPEIDAVSEFLQADLDDRSKGLGKTGTFLQVAPEPIEILLDGPLQKTSEEIVASTLNSLNLKEQIAESDRMLAITDEMLAELEAKMVRLAADRTRLLESDIDTNSLNDKALRTASRCRDLSTIMKHFKSSMTTRHLGQLEKLILEGYQTLLRKGSLITKVTIDPSTFNIHLLNASAYEIPLDRLSAGERQLLAISILWGLGKASGHTLPTIIDTPLGRLDGSHRLNIVNSYFPFASHQVILLSTDEEIDELYYKELKESIGHEYNIQYDDAEEASLVTSGYFWKGAA